MDSGRLEAVPAGAVNLDTVRALHQTVVSLRTALEVSKNELKELKEKYQKHSECIEYADVIEKLSIENHILRRKIIDTDLESKSPSLQNLKLQVTYGSKQHLHDLDSEVVIQTATTEARTPAGTSRATDESEHGDRVFEEERSIGEEIEVKDNIICPEKEQLAVLEQVPVTQEHSSDESLEEVEEKEASPIELASAESSPASDQEESPEGNASTDISPENDKELSIDVEEISPRFDLPNDVPGIFKTKLELLSKFDVRIKVRTLKEGTVLSTTTSDSESTVEEKRERFFEKRTKDRTFEKGTKENTFQKDRKNNTFETDRNENVFERDSKVSGANFHFGTKREHFENVEDPKGRKVNIKTASTENIRMAVPNEGDAKVKADKFDVQVRITSEENLMVKESIERRRRKDMLNLDVDNLSLRSMSEGDNSVFSEQATTPLEQATAHDRSQQSDDSEVDDIELIFTADESKDMSNLQEDLVSIRDNEPWTPHSSTAQSTPVLIKFHTLDADFQPDAPHESPQNRSVPDLKTKRVSLPCDKDISMRHVAFDKDSLDLPGRGILKSCDNRSDTMLSRSPTSSSRRLASVDSLTSSTRGLSLERAKSSSLELELGMGSSADMLPRDESVDSFRRTRFGHRFSVFAECDMSKCGISEDDLASACARRNTCPNPFQYRAPPRPVSRAPGSFRVPGGRLRPILRDGTHPRRESGAQTDVSALPPRWGSDGYLTYKMCAPPLLALPALPARAVAAGSGAGGAGGERRPAAPRPPPQRHEDKRVLLSDIGFTSMVPELSRSADPLWAMTQAHAHAQRQASDADASPLSTSTYKFLSRGSSFRSACVSMDRSTDWTPQTAFSNFRGESGLWRTSLPDVRPPRQRQGGDADDTDALLRDADAYLRRSVDNLRAIDLHLEVVTPPSGQPYIPREPKQLRLGHAVKVITPFGRVAVGRVRYVGIAGVSAATSSVVVGAEFPLPLHASLPRNDGTHNGRRYFLAAAQHTALFVPFAKVVMAWAN